MSDVRLILFGAPKLERSGRPIRLATRKNLALLAYLAVTAQEHSREALCALLWPEQNERRARANLRQSLSVIRHHLGGEFLLTSGSRVALCQDPELDVDVTAFRRLVELGLAHKGHADGPTGRADPLTEAVALYAGDFLAGFTLPDCPQFDEWCYFEADELRHTLDQALQALIRRHRRAQDYASAIDCARHRLLLDRLHEPAQRELMELYALNGQSAAAMRQFDEFVHVLDTELGVPPEDETVALYTAVLERRYSPGPRLGGDAHTSLTTTTHALSGTQWRPSTESAGDINLPVPPTPFVGREDELSEVLTLLQDPTCRLLTLVAPGGMGKTRLAVEAGRRLAEDSCTHAGFAQGIIFVPLQPVHATGDIVAAIGEAAGFHAYSDRSPFEQLLDFLRPRRMLLILDTFEHLLGATDLVAQMLAAAPHVKILVTSREALRLRQEWFYPLAGMRFTASATGDGQNAADYDAVQLFVQSGRRAQPHFQLAENQAHVLRICALVDGMPLGIELAAAWLKVLSCTQIAGEIERGLDILTARHQDVPERHRSMRVLFDNSWQLLATRERIALKRLSIFRGEFARRAAEDIAGVSLLTLAALVEKSLLQSMQGGYYQMHELLRQYSAERLGLQPAEEEDVRARHMAYYCGILHKRDDDLKCGRQRAALTALTWEGGNLQSAWARAAVQRDPALVGTAMDGLGYFYAWTGNFAGGTAAFGLIVDDQGYEASLALRRIQAHALAWAANFARLSGQTDAAAALLTRSMASLDKLEAAGADVQWPRALALLHWGHLMQPRDLNAAVDAYRQSAACVEAMDNRWAAAMAWAWLGAAEREIGRFGEAIKLLRRAQVVFEECGDEHSVAMVLENIARAYLLDQADLDLALATAQACLELRRASGDRAGTATTLLVLSYVHCWLNQPAAAMPLMEEALAIARDLGHRAVECEAYYIAMVIYNYLEDREKKAEMGARGLALARALGDVRLISNFLRSVGTQALIRGDYDEAHAMHVEAFEIQERAGIQVMLPWLHVVRAYSSWKIGELDEARSHIAHALRMSVARSDYYTAVHALLFTAQLIAAHGDPVLAAEIGATARACSRWEKSLTGRVAFVEPLDRLTQELPPEALAAARARGRARDLFATAAELLAELEAGAWVSAPTDRPSQFGRELG